MTSPVTDEKILVGRMPRMILAVGTGSALPLEHTSVTVQVNAAMANVLVAQRFGNNKTTIKTFGYNFWLE